jgi:hypothetical protein
VWSEEKVLNRRLTLVVPMLLCLVAGAFPVCGRAQSPVAPVLTQEQVIRGIDAAVQHRAQSVASYTVQELYSIYRNGEAAPSAQVTVKTVYTRNSGKEYTTVSSTGSSLIRSAVVDKVLAHEKEMAMASNRERVAITSSNYEMTLLPGIEWRNGRDCVVVELKARRKIPYLFNGKAWFDASDQTLVHIEGAPAASASFFAGETRGLRELDWFAPWTRCWTGMAVGEVVCGRQAEPELQLRGPSCAGRARDKVALLWEGEPGEVRRLTFAELHAQVQRFANVLKGLGVKKGDRVAIYMGMCRSWRLRCWRARGSARCIR